MPAVPDLTTPTQDLQNPFRVLVTGFGPFSHYEENPSWLAVKPLQNLVLHTGVTPDRAKPADTSSSSSSSSSSISISAKPPVPLPPPRPIHISTLEVPVTYEAVLDMVPGLHARPPVLPTSAPPSSLPPPETAFDFIFHIGVAGRGPLRMERLGHKLGYHMKDATGKYAGVVRSSHKDFRRRDGEHVGIAIGMGGMSAAEAIERERLGMALDFAGAGGLGDGVGEGGTRPTRGLGGPAYDAMSDEISTDVDVTRLVQELRRSGVEQIYSSMDAGHFLCDFIYYCSLAEAKRSSKPYEKRRHTQVLFLHCPPVGQPLSSEEVTDAIKRIVVWVCEEQQLLDDSDSAGAPGAPGK